MLAEEEHSAPSEHIPTRKFHLPLPDARYGASVLLLGSTRSGKTTLQNYIHKEYFHKVMTCVHTWSPQSGIYSELKKRSVFMPDYRPDIINETYQINKACNNRYRFLHIVDDVVGKKNDPMLMKLLTILRNSRISAMITGQELSIFNAICRSNINFVFLGYLNSDMAIKKVVEAYLRTYFPKHYSVLDCMREYKAMTADKYFILIDNIHGTICRTKLDLDAVARARS